MIFGAAWASLGVGLFLTLWVVVLLIRVILVGLDINRLAARILPAADGIAANTATIANLDATPRVAGELLNACRAIGRVSGTIEQGVEGLAQTLGSQRGSA